MQGSADQTANIWGMHSGHCLLQYQVNIFKLVHMMTYTYLLDVHQIKYPNVLAVGHICIHF